MPHGVAPPPSAPRAQTITTVAAARAHVEAVRFSNTVEGKKKADSDAALPLRAILEKLRRVTYATGFSWEEAFGRAPPYPEDDQRNAAGESQSLSTYNAAPYSPPPALACTTDQAFVDIIHGCNAAAMEKLENPVDFEINAGEYEVLLRRYSDYKGRIRWRKFVKDLAIGQPEDYADPELRFDVLPMPFRMINEVLDEWLDDIWDVIAAKTGLNDAGGSSSADASSAMAGMQNRSLFYPTTISNRVTSNIGQPRFMSPCGSWDLGDRVVISTDAGELIIFDGASDQLLAITTPFPDSAGGITCMSIPRASDSCISSPTSQGEPVVLAVCASAETVSDRDARLAEVAEKARAAAAAAAAAAAEGDGEAAAGKKGSKKKKGKKDNSNADGDGGSDNESPDPGGLLALYEIWPHDPMFVPVGNLRTEQSITSVTVSRGSDFMSVTLADGTVSVYKIPPRPSDTEENSGEGDATRGNVDDGPREPAKGKLPEVPEGTEEDDTALGGGLDLGMMPVEYARRSRSVVTFDKPTLRLRKGASDIEVVRPFPVPVPPSTLDRPSTVASEASSVLSSSDDASSLSYKPMKRLNLEDPPMVHFTCLPTAPDPLSMPTVSSITKTCAVLVWRPKTNVLRRYLLPVVDSTIISEENSDNRGDVDSAAAVMAADKQRAGDLFASEWIAPAAITSSCLDPSDETVVVGLSDGSVYVLDIRLGCPRCIPRRHISPKGRGVSVSAVSVFQQKFVISGAVDGSIMVTDVSSSDIFARALSVLTSEVQTRKSALRGRSRGGNHSSDASTRRSARGGQAWTPELPPASKMLLSPSRDLSAPILAIRCMQTVPIAVVSTEDGSKATAVKLYDLANGLLMGYASPVPIASQKVGGIGGSGGLDNACWVLGSPRPVEWPPLEGFESLPPKDIRTAVTSARNSAAFNMGGALFLDRDALSRSMVAVCRDNIFALCNYQGKLPEEPVIAAPAVPEADPESNDTSEENPEEPEVAKPAKPAAQPLQFHRYVCGDLLCELFPGIAASCYAGGAAGSVKYKEREDSAKRLFIMSTPGQRCDPNAKLDNLLLGPMSMHRNNNNKHIVSTAAGSTASGVGSSVYRSESVRSHGSKQTSRAKITRDSHLSGSRQVAAGASRMSVTSISRNAGKLTSQGSVASTETLGSSLMRGGAAKGIPSLIRGPRINEPMPEGISVPRAAGASEVARSFAMMRELKRASMEKHLSKRHQELRSAVTKY